MEIKDKELHRVAITAIIYKDNKYLITKRSPTKKAHPNRWTVPGGGIHVDDYIDTPQTNGNAGWYGTVIKTLTREVKEEVNIEIKNIEYLLDLTFIRPDGIPVLVLSYMAEYASGEVKIDADLADTVDVKWVTLEEAKNYDLIEGIWDELEMVEKVLAKRK